MPLTINGRPLLGPAGAYLQPVLHRDNLEVRADTRVCWILFTGSRAVGVECMGGEILAVNLIILCDNAIGSTRLLMLFGIDPAADLEVRPRTAGFAATVHRPGHAPAELPHLGVALRDGTALVRELVSGTVEVGGLS